MLASQRAPAEIWRTILTLAVDSPLLPHQTSDIVDVILLFSSQCISQQYQKEVEARRTRLRLVCQAWNEFLSNHGVAMVLEQARNLPLVGKSHNTAQRLEVLTPFYCACSSPCIFSMTYAYPPSIQRVANNCDIVPSEICKVEVGIFPQDFSDMTTLAGMTQLQALHLAQPTHGSAELETLFRIPIVQDLVHLQLSDITSMTMESIKGGVTFHQLNSFSIAFVFRTYNSAPRRAGYTSISKWRFPVLRTLRVTGKVDVRLTSSVMEFLHMPRTQLTSLYLDLEYATAANLSFMPFMIKAGVWESFPKLQIFGVGLATLEQYPSPPPPSYCRFALAMDGIRRADSSSRLPFAKSASRLIQVFSDWNPKELIFLSSWKEMNACLQNAGSGRAVWPRGMMNAIMDRDIRLVDINRTPICDEAGILFLQNLHDGVPRKRKVPAVSQL